MKGSILIAAISIGLGLAFVLAAISRRVEGRMPLPRAFPGVIASLPCGPDCVVVAVEGDLALVAAPPNHEYGAPVGLWVKRSSLRAGDPAALPSCIRSASVADLRSELPRLPQPRGAAAQHGRMHRLGHFCYDARRTLVIGAVAIVLLCLPLASTVHNALSSGGFVPDGEAMQVEDTVRDRFGAPASEVAVLVPAPKQVVEPALESRAAAFASIDGLSGVVGVVGSPDDRSTLVTVGLRTTDDRVTRAALHALRRELDASPALHGSTMTGRAVFARDIELTLQRDLRTAEILGCVLALVVLLLVFGTLPAALIPLVVGSASVVLTFAFVHLLAYTMDISVFVTNVASLLGFGLGIDYSLIAVSRFRRELALGNSVRDATVTTVAHAGRTLVVSALAVLLGLSGMFLVPLGVMHSIAIGGVVVVAVSMCMAVVVLPALLAMFGHRIEAFPVRRRRADHAGGEGWRRLTSVVMRHPVVIVTVVLAALAGLALHAPTAKLEVPRQQALPAHVESNVAARAIVRDFGHDIAAPIFVVARTRDSARVAQLTTRVRSLDNVDDVRVRGVHGGETLMVVTTTRDRQGGPAAQRTVRDLRALSGSRGMPSLAVGGQFAWEQEFFDVLRHGMPLVLVVIFGSAFVVLAVAFRSLVIPIKALVLNFASITATLGIVVVVFQDRLGAGLVGAGSLTWVDASLPLVLLCLLFGLSMDYEVFMLASISESWHDGLDTEEATAEGIARTAPLVTGAALILVALGLSFATTDLVLVKQLGFGIAVALLLDATVVRALLVPGTMRLLGDANWWLPAWLARRVPVMCWA